MDPKRLADKLLFAGLTSSQLERIAEIIKVRTASPGEVIVREGDYGESLFLVAQGSVEVLARGGDGEPKLVGRVRAQEPSEVSFLGDFFGEMCLLDLEPRFATVAAVEEVTLWEINRDDLYWLFGDDKGLQLRILLTVARVLSRRLADVESGAERAPSGAGQ